MKNSSTASAALLPLLHPWKSFFPSPCFDTPRASQTQGYYPPARLRDQRNALLSQAPQTFAAKQHSFPFLRRTKFTTPTLFPAPAARVTRELVQQKRQCHRAITVRYRALPFIWGSRQIFKVFKFCGKGENVIKPSKTQSFCYSPLF